MKKLKIFANIAFSVLLSLAVAGIAGVLVWENSIGGYSAKTACGIIAFSAVFGVISLMKQSLTHVPVLTLIYIPPLVCAFNWLLLKALNKFLWFSPQLTRLQDMEVIQASFLALTGYLLVWERENRTEVKKDDLAEHIKALPVLWPVVVYAFIILGIEWIFW